MECYIHKRTGTPRHAQEGGAELQLQAPASSKFIFSLLNNWNKLLITMLSLLISCRY